MPLAMTPQCEVLIDGMHSASLPVHDRGLLYGDGVFRTLRVIAGKPLWWDEQVAKLTEDCARLGLFAPDPETWLADLEHISPSLTDGVLKLLVTRGSGPRGYQLPPAGSVRRLMFFDATTIQTRPRAGLRMRVCALRLGWQPRLAGIKHLNRLENVLARAEWNSTEFDEGLLLDQAERVVSGVMSNIFVWRHDQLLTPRIDRCGVAGVARARLMRLAKAQGVDVQETDLSLQAVFDADEVMLTNSVTGLRRVACLETKHWLDPVISPRMAEWLDA